MIESSPIDIRLIMNTTAFEVGDLIVHVPYIDKNSGDEREMSGFKKWKTYEVVSKTFDSNKGYSEYTVYSENGIFNSFWHTSLIWERFFLLEEVLEYE